MDLLSDIYQAIVELFQPVSRMPYATPFILAVSLLIALLSTWATMRFTDVEKMKQNMEEVKAWQEKLKRAQRTRDPILMDEVSADQGRILRLQGDMMQSRMKPMCIFFIPFLIIFGILNTVFGAAPVAILPFNVQKALPFLEGWLGVNVEGSGFGLYFVWWYLLSSFALGSLIRKVLGVDIGMGA